MNYEILKITLPLIITSIVTIVGWFIAYRFSVEKDRANKRKDLRVNYLIDAWRKLEFAVYREDYDRVEFLEKPIADIQLFGNSRQVELAQKFANDMANNQEASLTELLLALREDLRKELKMSEVPNEIKHIRFNKESNPKKLKS